MICRTRDDNPSPTTSRAPWSGPTPMAGSQLRSGLLDRGRRPGQDSAMSWCLSVHVRRIIAVVLLLFDLSREPDSALAFVGMDTDDDGVAELCTKDDFWWGTAASCAINEATAAGRYADYADHTSGRGSPPVTQSASPEHGLAKACHCAIVSATSAVVP